MQCKEKKQTYPAILTHPKE